MKTAAILIAALALAGCAAVQQDARQQLQRLTAGAVGCPPAEIVISDHRPFTWRAACRGRTFWCNGLDTLQCREEVAAR